MEHLRSAQQAIEDAKQQLSSAVRQARHDGHTWAEIGEALGMSRQAAFKRFGEFTHPATGQTMTGAAMSLSTIRDLTERVFTLISTGRSEELHALMHPETRAELPTALIEDTWTKVLSEVGTLESFSDTHVAYPAGDRIHEDAHVLGVVVGVTTLNCEAGEVMGRVALDSELRVVGLLLVAPDHQPVPF